MTVVTVQVSDELMAYLGSEVAAKEHLRRAAVLELVKRQVISQGRGAELLEISLWDLRQLMAEGGTPAVDLTEPELAEGHGNLCAAPRDEGGP